MKASAGALIAVPLFALAASAQEATKENFTGLCWEIYQGVNGVSPFNALMLNKCDGRTFILIRSNIADKQGRLTGSWVWRWAPLSIDQTEAVLSAPNSVP